MNEVVENTSKNYENSYSTRINSNPMYHLANSSSNSIKNNRKSLSTGCSLNNTRATTPVRSLGPTQYSHAASQSQILNERKSHKHIEISEFLKRIKLNNNYEYKFLTNGFDDISYLVRIFLFLFFYFCLYPNKFHILK